MAVEGKGPAGQISGDAKIELAEDGEGTLVSWTGNANVRGTLARVDVRLVVSERNTLSVGARNGRQLSTRLMPLLVRWAYPHADAVVAVAGVGAVQLLCVGILGEYVGRLYTDPKPVWVRSRFQPAGVAAVLLGDVTSRSRTTARSSWSSSYRMTARLSTSPGARCARAGRPNAASEIMTMMMRRKLITRGPVSAAQCVRAP